MELETILLCSELEFRHYVTQHRNTVQGIWIWEDVLDSIIYFYCFCSQGTIVATKESIYMHFPYYLGIYELLAKELSFQVSFSVSPITFLSLTPILS